LGKNPELQEAGERVRENRDSGESDVEDTERSPKGEEVKAPIGNFGKGGIGKIDGDDKIQ